MGLSKNESYNISRILILIIHLQTIHLQINVFVEQYNINQPTRWTLNGKIWVLYIFNPFSLWPVAKSEAN